MRSSPILFALALLTGCDRSPEGSPEPIPSPLGSGEQAQASIIRPDIATATPQAPPIEPLDIVVGFPDGGTEISETGIAQLQKLIASPQVKLGGAVELGAHSDSAGTDEANIRASRKRGEAVLAWLTEHGIAEDRLELVAFGEQNPVQPNAKPDGSPNETGRAANRRVEIRVPVASAPSAEMREPTLAEEIVEKTGTETLGPGATDNSD